MPRPELLLARLDAIARSLADSGHGLALLGLGSVGLERERLDVYSDLDFFAIVETGHKAAYIDDLGWLSAARPIDYAFRNTVDGYKILFDDGVFGEFAVFEPQELASIPFARGRIVWQRDGVDPSIAEPVFAQPATAEPTIEWLTGEALTNLFVGLNRYRRGERLSAQRFVQSYAVDRILELVERTEPAQAARRDAFARERRIEQRYPAFARELPDFAQGYDRTPESALAILRFLEARVSVNAALAAAIRALAHGEG